MGGGDPIEKGRPYRGDLMEGWRPYSVSEDPIEGMEAL